MTYSANEELRKLAQNLDFEIFLFDDPTTSSPSIKVNEKSKDREIDAIILYKNLVCLVEIDKGKRDAMVKKIKVFFEKLDKVNKPEQIKLEVKVLAKKGNDIEQKVNEVKAQIQTIENRINGSFYFVYFWICGNYYIIWKCVIMR